MTEHGASLSSQDIHGCTPLHLAAMLQNNEMLQQLKETAEKTDRAALAVRNSSYDTVETLQESLQNPPKIVPDRIVSYFEKDGSVTPLSAADFKALTETDYCSTILATPEILFKKWQSLTGVEAISPEHQRALEAYHTHPPKLILGEELSGNGKFSIGLGVKAGEKIEKGQVIRIYAGELDVDLHSAYTAGSRQGCIEPIRYGNEASRINDGYPNCVRISVGHKVYVIALKTLNQNEWLHLDYYIGHTYTKFGRYGIGNLKAAEFLVANWKKTIFDMTSETVNDSTKLAAQAQLTYLFQTPYVMTHMLLHGTIEEGLIAFLIQEESNREMIGMSSKMIGMSSKTSKNVAFALEYYNSLLSLLQHLKHHFLRKDVLHYFQTLLSQQPVIVAIQHINYLN